MAGEFAFVYIPADPAEPIQELRQQYTKSDEVECLLNRLKVGWRALRVSGGPASTTVEACRVFAQRRAPSSLSRSEGEARAAGPLQKQQASKDRSPEGSAETGLPCQCT